MVNKRKRNRRVEKAGKKTSPYTLIVTAFIITTIVILFLAFLSSTAYHTQQNEINLIQAELVKNPAPIMPVSLFYDINMAPSFNGGVCSTMINETCIIRETNMSQQNVFNINDTYSGNYSMSIFIAPPGRASLTMIIDYKNNNTQNTLTFNSLSGLSVFSGPQVPSTIKMIFSNEGNTHIDGYLKVNEMPK